MEKIGYSGTPLANKLGIKAGNSVGFIHAPDNYLDWFEDLPGDIQFDGEQPKDLIHLFTTQSKELSTLLPSLKDQIKQDGTIWVSWPKKADKYPTDLTEDSIRDIAMQTGLMDIKVCAFNEVWWGVKLVIPVRERK